MTSAMAADKSSDHLHSSRQQSVASSSTSCSGRLSDDTLAPAPQDYSIETLGFSQNDIKSLIADVLGSTGTAQPNGYSQSNSITRGETIAGAERSSESTPAPYPMQATEFSAAPDIILPSYVMFGPEAGQLEHVISRRTLEKLPKPAMARLASFGKYQGVILMMENYDDCYPMLRLKEFLETGNYSPFKPKIALEYFESNGAAKLWPANRDTTGAVKVTPNTHALLLREIEIYRFAIKIRYEDLRHRSSRHLRSYYPVSGEGIWALLMTLYRLAAQEARDAELGRYILELVSGNAGLLTQIKEYVPKMRSHIQTDGPLGTALFEGYVAAAEEARGKGMPAPIAPTPVKKEAKKEIKQEPSSPVAERRPEHLSVVPDGLRFADLDKLARAVNEGHLVVANESCYGSRILPGLAPRNKAFQVERGELLMINDLEKSTNGRHNVIVYNSRGHRGDILGTFFRKVPPNLGVSGVATLLTTPANMERKGRNGSSASMHPDREERLYSGGGRRRSSRSPPPPGGRYR